MLTADQWNSCKKKIHRETKQEDKRKLQCIVSLILEMKIF